MPNKTRPIHPGEILREELAELGLSASALAQELGVPANRITGILNEERAISADTAHRLAKFFRTTPLFWLHLQVAYEARVLELNKERASEYRKIQGGRWAGADGKFGPSRAG